MDLTHSPHLPAPSCPAIHDIEQSRFHSTNNTQHLPRQRLQPFRRKWPISLINALERQLLSSNTIYLTSLKALQCCELTLKSHSTHVQHVSLQQALDQRRRCEGQARPRSRKYLIQLLGMYCLSWYSNSNTTRSTSTFPSTATKSPTTSASSAPSPQSNMPSKREPRP